MSTSRFPFFPLRRVFRVRCSCRARRRRAGSTLLLALWALFMLSAVILAWAKFIDRGIAGAYESNLALEAKALAHSGVAIALHPQITRVTPVLEASLAPDRSYHATIEGEGGKLNLSYLIYGEDPVRLSILKNYLALRGLDTRQQERFVDCLLDWVSPGNVRHLNGAKEDADYKPSGKPLTSLDEIPLIKGSDALLSRYPGWRDDFTLWSTGPLDLAAASADLIALIPGIGEARAEEFVKLRQGSDKKDGTPDDHIFTSTDEVRSYLGMSQDQFSQISSLVSVNDMTVHIRSVGEAGEVHRQVEVIARKVQGRNPQIFLWTEK